jgi:hypothetical protein
VQSSFIAEPSERGKVAMGERGVECIGTRAVGEKDHDGQGG